MRAEFDAKVAFKALKGIRSINDIAQENEQAKKRAQGSLSVRSDNSINRLLAIMVDNDGRYVLSEMFNRGMTPIVGRTATNVIEGADLVGEIGLEGHGLLKITQDGISVIVDGCP